MDQLEKNPNYLPIGIAGLLDLTSCNNFANESTVSGEEPVTRIFIFFLINVSERTRAISDAIKMQLLPVPGPPFTTVENALPPFNAFNVL